MIFIQPTETFGRLFKKLFGKLKSLEDVKYIPPKFSYSMHDLANDLGISIEEPKGK